MELNNWETEFRNKLNDREISPSKNSWERLDSMLTEAEEKTTKLNYNWLFIAASLIGILFIGTMFFRHTDELIDLERNNVVLENKETSTPPGDSVFEKSQITISPLPKRERLVIATKRNETTTKAEGSPEIQTIEPTSSITSNTEETEKSISLNPDFTEVDQLLASVKSSEKNETLKIKVNSHNLLREADSELELSFREKVINSIDKKYQNVKMALSNRNYNK